MSPVYHGSCSTCKANFTSYEPTNLCMSCTIKRYLPEQEMIKPKHKHAEFIKAWADGIAVQWRCNKASKQWHDLCVTDPVWNVDYEFRIKPAEKVTRWLWVYKNSTNIWRISTRYLTEHEAALFYGECKKLDWSAEEFDE